MTRPAMTLPQSPLNGKARRDWPAILETAAAIVNEYSTPPTLRQLYYQLVARGVIPNSQTAYQQLSSYTARARRDGWFPTLTDRTRHIERQEGWESLAEAVDATANYAELPHADGQPWRIYLGIEKDALAAQLASWFKELGVGIVALRGYSSQTLVDDVRAEIGGEGAVLIYGGDFDPTGEDVLRDFTERVAVFAEVRRVALNAEQIAEYRLPPMPGKHTDSRAAGFVARHGELVQVELDALDPVTLRALYTGALSEYWDGAAYQAVLDREGRERVAILKAIEPLTRRPQ